MRAPWGQHAAARVPPPARNPLGIGIVLLQATPCGRSAFRPGARTRRIPALFSIGFSLPAPEPSKPRVSRNGQHKRRRRPSPAAALKPDPVCRTAANAAPPAASFLQIERPNTAASSARSPCISLDPPNPGQDFVCGVPSLPGHTLARPDMPPIPRTGATASRGGIPRRDAAHSLIGPNARHPKLAQGFAWDNGTMPQ